MSFQIFDIKADGLVSGPGKKKCTTWTLAVLMNGERWSLGHFVTKSDLKRIMNNKKLNSRLDNQAKKRDDSKNENWFEILKWKRDDCANGISVYEKLKKNDAICPQNPGTTTFLRLNKAVDILNGKFNLQVDLQRTPIPGFTPDDPPFNPNTSFRGHNTLRNSMNQYVGSDCASSPSSPDSMDFVDASWGQSNTLEQPQDNLDAYRRDTFLSDVCPYFPPPVYTEGPKVETQQEMHARKRQRVEYNNGYGLLTPKREFTSRENVFHVQDKAVFERTVQINDIVYAHNFRRTSDMRAKTDIVGIKNPMDTVRQLEGKWASWNTERFPNLPADKRFMCFIAQDLKKVVPELVEKDPETKLYNVNDQVSPLLVEAVKHVDNDVEHLKQQVKDARRERDAMKKERDIMALKVDQVVEQVQQQNERMAQLEDRMATQGQPWNTKSVGRLYNNNWIFLLRVFGILLLQKSSNGISKVATNPFQLLALLVFNIVLCAFWIFLKFRKNRMDREEPGKREPHNVFSFAFYNILMTFVILNVLGFAIMGGFKFYAAVCCLVLGGLFWVIYNLYTDKKMFFGRCCSVILDLNFFFFMMFV
mmetsp:Transcript_3904/g.4323  ORF Transcript_3904/g.4323 Transcript_3904/m.4323 type:complete len:589 (+) Transcript_3904:33-1799(+)